MKKSRNLVDYYDALTSSEKKVLCGILSKHGGIAVHLGSLPFISLRLAQTCLTKALDGSINHKTFKAVVAIREKLGEAVIIDGDSFEFQMHLDNAKVRKFSSGKSDDRLVVKLPFVVKRKVGLQWQEFGKKWIHPEVHVPQVITFHRLHGNLWRVTAPRSLDARVREFVFNRYG